MWTAVFIFAWIGWALIREIDKNMFNARLDKIERRIDSINTTISMITDKKGLIP